ncbi:MAG TPA: sulfotransferase [Anaerolineae bacterium]
MATTKQALKTIVPAPIRSTTKKQINSLHYHIWKYRAKEEPVLKEPIFMIGCPRSGTTISVKLFATHPWLANWSEAGRVWDPAGYDDPSADHCWSADSVTDEDVRRLHSKFEWYRQFHKKRRFINKHPRNSVRIDYIRKIFPDALFIHVIRDGRAVVNSIVKRIERDPERQHIPFGDFCKPPDWRQYLRDEPVEQAALQWREITRYVLDKRDELGDRYYELKYEHMCQEPREVFAAAFEFAGLPVSAEFLAGIPERLRNMNHKYEENLSATQIATINTIQEELLETLQYPV